MMRTCVIDLFGNLMLEVINAADQGGTKRKTSALITIAEGKDSKSFDVPIDMLNINSALRKIRIERLFSCR